MAETPLGNKGYRDGGGQAFDDGMIHPKLGTLKALQVGSIVRSYRLVEGAPVHKALAEDCRAIDAGVLAGDETAATWQQVPRQPRRRKRLAAMSSAGCAFSTKRVNRCRI